MSPQTVTGELTATTFDSSISSCLTISHTCLSSCSLSSFPARRCSIHCAGPPPALVTGGAAVRSFALEVVILERGGRAAAQRREEEGQGADHTHASLLALDRFSENDSVLLFPPRILQSASEKTPEISRYYYSTAMLYLFHFFFKPVEVFDFTQVY